MNSNQVLATGRGDGKYEASRCGGHRGDHWDELSPGSAGDTVWSCCLRAIRLPNRAETRQTDLPGPVRTLATRTPGTPLYEPQSRGVYFVKR